MHFQYPLRLTSTTYLHGTASKPYVTEGMDGCFHGTLQMSEVVNSIYLMGLSVHIMQQYLFRALQLESQQLTDVTAD